jgi:hypothetical protein
MIEDLTVIVAEQRVTERIKNGTERRLRAGARTHNGRRSTHSMLPGPAGRPPVG